MRVPSVSSAPGTGGQTGLCREPATACVCHRGAFGEPGGASGSPPWCFFPPERRSVPSRGTESQNHRMVGVGRDLCGSSSPTLLPKQGHLQQAADDLVQAGLEYLQRKRLHNLPGQPVPLPLSLTCRSAQHTAWFLPFISKPSALGPLCSWKRGRRGMREQSHRAVAQGEGEAGKVPNLKIKKLTHEIPAPTHQERPRRLTWGPEPCPSMPTGRVPCFCSACPGSDAVAGEPNPRCGYYWLKTLPSTFRRGSQHRSCCGPSSSQAGVSPR